MIEIKSIKIEIGGVEINLTPQEARELQEKLADVFNIEKYKIIPITYPYPFYPNPYPQITCGSATGIAYEGITATNSSITQVK